MQNFLRQSCQQTSQLNSTPCPHIKRLSWQLKAKVGLACGPILDFYLARLLNDPPMEWRDCRPKGCWDNGNEK